MARYLARRGVEGFSVVSAQTGRIAIVNGRLLDELDEDEADDFVDLINCVEGESLMETDDVGETAEATSLAAVGASRPYAPVALA